MLKRRIVELVEREGPIPFERFMEIALYDPEEGYFGAGPLRSGREGDFLTSPEVSPLFGSTLARFVEGERERLGDPERFRLLEVGAGSGSLLRPLLEALERPVEAWAVEISPQARRAMVELLGEERVVASMEELPEPFRGVVVANEVVDNLPAALGVRTSEGWEERWVGIEDGELILVGSPARPEVVDWLERLAGPVPEGGLVEVQLEAARWLAGGLGRLEAGSVVVIDYGDVAGGLASRRAEGTLRTYRGHHLGPDVLAEPGETDITMDVNFTALVETAREQGAEVELLRQEEFLALLGLEEVLEELRRRELSLARQGDPMERLRVRSERTAGETLLHPRGLGDFRVLIARR